MVQELLPLLPKEVGALALSIAVVGALVGLGLWLVGARFSRSMITLLLVSAGGWLGLFLPRWVGWSIDGWATAIGLAVALGASGFFLHRVWVGAGFGVLLAGWAAVVVWLACRGAGIWSLPQYEPGRNLAAYAKDLWLGLPPDVRRYLPPACGAAAISGLASALLWPRFGVVSLYSTAGVTMLLGMGLAATNAARPQWLGALPARTSSQAIILLAMAAFGAVLQWRIAPSKKAPRGKPPVVVHD